MEPESGLSDDMIAYLRFVHRALATKNRELQALQMRFEPRVPKRGVRTDREPPDGRQAYHVLRRYDESLSYYRGYSYDPEQAYFDRDAYGTGQLRFENGATLLGTIPEQDRWLRLTTAPQRLDPQSEPEPEALVTQRHAVTATARVDAFLAMLQNRQSLTMFAGMAPLCFFIGDLYHLPVRIAGLRTPAKPPDKRIPFDMQQRFCVAMHLQEELEGSGGMGLFGTGPTRIILGVLVIERNELPSVPETGPASTARRRKTRRQKKNAQTVALTGYLLTWGPLVTQDPGNETHWQSRMVVFARGYWDHLLRRRESYQIFDRVPNTELRIANDPDNNTAGWSMSCPEGEPEFYHRLSLLLESPDLRYAPWQENVAIGSLKRILRAAPITNDDGNVDLGTDRLRPEDWVRFTLMSRVYPYALLGLRDMKDRKRYKAYDKDVPLTPYQVRQFRDMVIAVEDTLWADDISTEVNRRKYRRGQLKQQEKKKREKVTAKQRLPVVLPQTSLLATKDVYPAAGHRPHHHPNHDHSDRHLVVGAKGKGKKGPIEISRPRQGGRPATDAVVQQLISGPSAILRAMDAVDARFLAVRNAEIAVGRLDPLYVTTGEVWSRPTAYKTAKEWRQLLERDEVLRWKLGAELLDLLYPDGAAAIWKEGQSPRNQVSFPRAHWERRIENRAPDPFAASYRRLAQNTPVALNPFVVDSKQWKQNRAAALQRDATQRSELMRILPDWARDRNRIDQGVRERTKWPVLMGFARGIAPPEKGRQQADLQRLALAIGLSLIKDGQLEFVPPKPTWVADAVSSTDKTRVGRLFRSNISAAVAVVKSSVDDSISIDWDTEEQRGRLRAMGTFALIAWDWGGIRGLLNYFQWVDRIADQMLGRNGSDGGGGVTETLVRPPVVEGLISNELLNQFVPLRELMAPVTAVMATAVFPKESARIETSKVSPPPQPIAPPSADESSLLAYVESLHGYQAGSLKTRFGRMATAWSQGVGPSPAESIETGDITVRLAGFGPPQPSGRGSQSPDAQPAWIYVGWQRARVARAPARGLKVFYESDSGVDNTSTGTSGRAVAFSTQKSWNFPHSVSSGSSRSTLPDVWPESTCNAQGRSWNHADQGEKRPGQHRPQNVQHPVKLGSGTRPRRGTTSPPRTVESVLSWLRADNDYEESRI